MGYILKTEKILEKFKIKHNNKYKYNLIKNYNYNSLDEIDILCSIHGIFTQSIKSHCSGRGCNQCAIDLRAQIKIQKAKNIFEHKANVKHNNLYKYDKVNYINAKTKVTIICNIHGDFYLTPNKHLNGRGCQLCALAERDEKRRKDISVFINEANIEHNNRYHYNLVEYINTDTKICILCTEHGDFWQTPNHHIKGNGCPSCNKNGFNHSRPSFFYIQKIESQNNIISYKFGITNTSAKQREYRQNNLSKYDVTNIFNIKLIGYEALELENIIKCSIKTNYLSKDVFSDGYTETFNPKFINDVETIITDYINELSNNN